MSLMPSVWRKSCCGSNRIFGPLRSFLPAVARSKSLSMDRRFIPSWPPASSPSRRSSLRRHARKGERPSDCGLRIADCGFAIGHGRGHPTKSAIRNPQSAIRRVTGAWWSPRSSKPLSARFTGRGMFDSYPLRLPIADCGLRIADLRLAMVGATQPNPQSAIRNPQSAIRKGVMGMSRRQTVRLTSLSSCAG